MTFLKSSVIVADVKMTLNFGFFISLARKAWKKFRLKSDSNTWSASSTTICSTSSKFSDFFYAASLIWANVDISI